MTTAFKESQKFYQKFIFGMKANFLAKFEANLRTSTYHPLHDFYMNLYLKYKKWAPRKAEVFILRGSKVSSFDFSTIYSSLLHGLIKAKVISCYLMP